MCATMGVLWLDKGPTFIETQSTRFRVLYSKARVRRLFRLNVREYGCSLVSQGSDVYSDSMCAIMGQGSDVCSDSKCAIMGALC